jgi:hypothetical protein
MKIQQGQSYSVNVFDLGIANIYSFNVYPVIDKTKCILKSPVIFERMVLYTAPGWNIPNHKFSDIR